MQDYSGVPIICIYIALGVWYSFRNDLEWSKYPTSLASETYKPFPLTQVYGLYFNIPPSLTSTSHVPFQDPPLIWYTTLPWPLYSLYISTLYQKPGLGIYPVVPKLEINRPLIRRILKKRKLSKNKLAIKHTLKPSPEWKYALNHTRN